MLDFFFICNIYKFTRDEDTDEVTAVATVTLRSLISLLTHIICNGNWQTTGRTWAKAHGSLKEEPKQKKKKHRVSLKNILSMYTIHGEKCSSVSATVGQYYLYYTVSGGEARKKKREKGEKYFSMWLARESRSHPRCCCYRHHRCHHSAKKQVPACAVSKIKVNI